MLKPLPDHWKDRNERYLAFPGEIGLARWFTVIFCFTFFAIGVGVLGMVFFCVIPRLFQFDVWWGGPVVLLMLLLHGSMFTAAGLWGMFHREGAIFDRNAKTCVIWWRFLWWGKTDIFSIDGYDAAEEVRKGSGIFGSAFYSPQLTGPDRPPIQIDAINERWSQTRKIAVEIAHFLWS